MLSNAGNSLGKSMKSTGRATVKSLCLLLLCICICQKSAAAIGDWTIHSAYHNAEKVAVLDDVVYVLCDGSLFSYDSEDTSVETYSKTDVLNGSGIIDILPCRSEHLLVIVYEDGNIDLLGSDGDAYNMPELYQKTLDDKTINDVMAEGSKVYVSTNAGIVVIDVRRRVVENFYSFGHQVRSVVISGGDIIAACSDGVFKGKLTSNLLDRNNWSLVSSAHFTRLISLDSKIFAYSSSLYEITDNSTFGYKSLGNYSVSNWNVVGDRLFVYASGKVVSVGKDGSVQSIDAPNVNYMTARNAGNYWVASSNQGLMDATLSGNAVKPAGTVVCPEGPWRNYAYNMTMQDGTLLIAGGAFTYPEVKREGTIMQYADGKWSAFDETEAINTVGADFYRNITDVVRDGSEQDHYFASAACSGLYEFRDGKMVAHYSYDNSPLRSILPNASRAGYYVRVTGLAYDSDNNLWMLNNECDTIVRVLKNNGKWGAYYFPEIKGYPTFDQVMFDRRGWAWINSRRSTSSGHRAGFLVLDNNGTVNQLSDDRHKFITSFRNQDGTSYTPTLLNCICEDLDGAVWIGTELGPFMIENPAEVFNSDFSLTQVKVPRNDGSNLADYLLSGVQIKCITCDGGNRKWFGTAGNGVYLVSADGTEVIQHFTTENSPLISDEIFDIAIDGKTGEVFFATVEGLVSYRGDATDPMPELNKDNVRVFPNPVRPDYNGIITVTGLMSGTDVKIVNAAGRLVNQGTSVGGEYTWNGCTADGRRAASGIYYVLAADCDGNDGVATKFLIVK